MINNWSFRILLPFVLYLLVHSLAIAQCIDGKYPLTKFKNIAEVTSDTFRISVMVVDVYRCPPCPEGAQCKPCIGDHILVKENKSGAEALRVFTRDPDQFTKDKRYVLTVRSRTHVKDRRKDFLELVTCQAKENKREK